MTPSKGIAGSAGDPSVQELCASCAEALQPIAEQFLELGFGAPLFVQVAKRAYLKAAIAAIRQSGQRPTDSRVAAITGLHRKEIRLLTRDGDDEPLSVKLPPATRVMNGWDTDPTYKNKNGRPRSLRIDGEASFKTLVETYAGDVTHVALLRELERLKWVKRGASGKVEMHRSATDSRKRAEAVEYFAARIADYATALASPDGSFDSGAYAGHRESAPTDRRIGAALTRTFSRRAEEFLNSFDRWVLRSSKQTAGSRSASKYGIGVYLVERKVSDGVRALPKKGAQRLSSRAKRA